MLLQQRPMTDTPALPLSADLLTVLSELGHSRPTEIQSLAVPVLLTGRDLIGQSQTGSGKTAAFCLPILERLPRGHQRVLAALVLCPTRELCAQVARELRRLGRRHAGLSVVSLAGGERIGPQRARLEHGVHVAVGTPGRILDHLRRGSLQLQTLRTVVLDEADRMLDMGFAPDVQAILEQTPNARQTVFFSATFPRSVEELSAKFQREPVRVSVRAEPTDQTTLRQLYSLVTLPGKPEALRALLARYAQEITLVFVREKATAAELNRNLRAAGVSADALHGDLMQSERDLAMAKLRNRSTRVLIATDVAARGIDVTGLGLVVNYDLPTRFDVYLHRVGRTARAGDSGLAISLVTKNELERIAALERAHGVVIEPLQLRAADPTDTESASASQTAPAPSTPAPAGAAMDTLRISGGRKEKVRPADILGALTGEAAGLPADDIGKIEIHDHFAYVAVAKRSSKRALRGLSDGRIKGRRFRVELMDA
jgi:ATP-independent RNA helicase DbpA